MKGGEERLTNQSIEPGGGDGVGLEVARLQKGDEAEKEREKNALGLVAARFEETKLKLTTRRSFGSLLESRAPSKRQPCSS